MDERNEFMPFEPDELAEPIDEDEVPEADTTERFVVDSDIKAEWCIRKIAEIQQETERWGRFYDERKKAVEESNMFRIAHLKQLLIPYINQVPMKEGKTQKKYTLPSGDLVIKKEHTKIEHDDAKLLEWLKNTPDGRLYIKKKESVDWRALKPELIENNGMFYFSETGECVDGVSSVVVPAEFVVTPKGCDTM